MYNFLLEPNAAGKQELVGFWDKFTVGGTTFVRGMCTVFAVLSIIWLCLSILRFFVYDLPRRRAEAPVAEQAKAAAEAKAPAPAALTATDDSELIAVITAAIAAATADQGGGKFRVVSFHRVNK